MKHVLSRALLLGGFAASLLTSPGAEAQIGAGLRPGGPMAPMPNANDPNAGTAPRQSAPGLPGAQTDRRGVAPAERPGSDMRPTEALFDAINRGDIGAARDAVRRGADLRARSVLGLTPLELAVDLGRRDISFLLLSLRGVDEQSGPRERPETAAPSAAEQARAAKLQAERAEAQRRAAARTPPPSGPAAAQNPRLFAGDGGQPVPEAGFLGFGGPARPGAR